MKIIFFGSDDFAAFHLNQLLSSEHEVVACVTHPDVLKGRGLKMISSPVKEVAIQEKIPLYQPLHLKEDSFLHPLKDLRCDLFVVVSFGKILPPSLLFIPYVCAINVHGSLLPKYRGAAPINWAIIKGEEETGVSIIKMNAQLDQGDIFAQEKIKIAGDDTAVTLRSQMAVLGAELLLRTINSLENNSYSLAVQDQQKATYAPKLAKQLGKIDWKKSSLEIHNLVRGLLPWPTAFTYCRGQLLKILETKVVDIKKSTSACGTVVGITQEGFHVETGKGQLLIKKVHPESSKVMEARSFMVGYKIQEGLLLG